MNAQQKYRLVYLLKIITFLPVACIGVFALPVFWVITGKNSLDWIFDTWLNYEEPKKPKNPNQAIVGQGEEREVWNQHNRIPKTPIWQRDTIFSPPPKPIPPPKPNTNIDPYEY